MYTLITDHGAVADKTTNNANAIQRAVDSCQANGGGTVAVPAGKTFMTGSFSLASHVCLHLEPGAVLLASPQINDYHRIDPDAPQQPADADNPNAIPIWIHTTNAQSPAITGTGTLDGNHEAFISEKRKENWIAANPRAQAVVFFGCTNLQIRNITIRHTPSWALRPCGCDGVLIDGITIDNSTRLVNTDGIDPDHCRNVRISNCNITTGDDGIVIKARKETNHYGPCENITITNCTVCSTCTAIKIGTESHADIRNVTVSNCVIHNSSRGLAVDGRDAGVVENILFSDILIQTRLFHPVWWSKAEPIYIAPLQRPESDIQPGPHRNIRFRNILCRSENSIYVHGPTVHRMTDLVFDHVTIELGRITDWEGGTYDPRPTPTNLAPAGTTELREKTPWGSLAVHRNAGFFFESVDNVTLNHCNVRWIDDPPPAWFSHAIEAHDVIGLDILNFKGKAAHPEDADRLID